jgi:hypothetical protein
MSKPTSLILARLKSRPLQAAVLKVARPFHAWIATHVLPDDTGLVFESVSVELGDLVYVDGHHNVGLLREQQIAPLRMLNVATSHWHTNQAPASPTSHRVRAVQCVLDAGLLRLHQTGSRSALACLRKVSASTLPTMPSGIAALARHEGDLVPTDCGDNTEWRLLATTCRASKTPSANDPVTERAA